MKKILIGLVIFIFTISLITIVTNVKDLDVKLEENTTPPKTEYIFKQVGYFKGENKQRYFTFYILTNKDSLSIDRNNLNEDLLKAIKSHGSNQQNTKGQNTVSFYYTSKEETPDITLFNASKAREVAHNKNPIASVWNYGNGNIKIIKNP